MVNSITSKADSIQVVYDNYINNKYIVNRRYQRKLVWTQQEKVAFIDSIVKIILYHCSCWLKIQILMA